MNSADASDKVVYIAAPKHIAIPNITRPSIIKKAAFGAIGSRIVMGYRLLESADTQVLSGIMESSLQ